MPRMPRKRPIDYILPFLIMICAGVIVVLAYQLWSSLNTSQDENDVYMFTAEGSAKILPWGAGEWEKAYNGTRLLQGDSLKTQKGGRVVIEFFEDHYIRMDERSEVIISNIKDSSAGYEIDLIVRDGRVWFNSDDSSENPVKFTVKTDHTVVRTLSTVYVVEQHDDREIIRVIKGNIEADILIDEEGQQKTIETITIGIGQQAEITENDLKKYADRESPSVIDALSDFFKESGFYKWNVLEDQNPTDFALTGTSFDEALLDEGATGDVEILEEGDMAAPVITTPSTLSFSTPESSLTIRGTTVEATQKMMVDVTSGLDTETYELNLYVLGNTDWSFAISNAAGTMNPGLNTYKFYALGEGESKSSKTTLRVTFEGEGAAEEEEEEDADLDLGALSAPTVDSYNGGDSNEVDVDTVKVVGSVDGAKEVIVSGYTLQGFSPGDTTWTYYAKESLGNMDAGLNSFTVTAVASDGTQKSTNFTITYNKPAEEPVTEEPATEEPATGDVTT